MSAVMLGVWRRVRLRLTPLLVLMLLCAGAPAAAEAQERGAADRSPPEVIAPQTGAELSPLPPPATDRAYRHVFLAFGVAWALILVYGVVLARRVAAAERDVSRLVERGR
jgi:hypothetical protein